MDTPTPVLTWDSLLRTLSKQFGEDIAQDVMASYLKNNTEIQHSIRYFRKCAKNARLMQWRKPARRQVFEPETQIPAISTGAQQLTRCLLLEVWTELTTEQQERLLGTVTSTSSTARVRMYRLRRKLND